VAEHILPRTQNSDKVCPTQNPYLEEYFAEARAGRFAPLWRLFDRESKHRQLVANAQAALELLERLRQVG
jgi:hypothetical protein